MAAAVAQTPKIVSAINAGIQMGENTHHHDQSITPHSFAITKMIVSRPPIPTFMMLKPP
jgi:hypothetical protein